MTNRSPLSDFVSRLVAHMLPVTYFLVAVSFYLKTYDSAQVKITLAQIGCSLTAALWIVLLVLERRMPFRREDWPLAAPFVAVFASGLLSWAQSSFAGGSAEEGLRRVLYAFMGFITLAEFRGWDRQRRLLRWLLAAFAVVVFYGFVQYLDTRLFPPGPGQGLDPFIWRQAFGARVFSSFGNPNFYGNFLVIITPIILVRFLKDGGQVFRPYLILPVLTALVVLADKLWLGHFGGVSGDMRAAAGILMAGLLLVAAALVFWRTPTGAASGMLLFFGAMFVTLYATETKGAWVGFVGALVATSVLAALFLVAKSARQLTRRLLVAAAVTAVLGAGVVGYYARQRIQSVSFRVFTWISTWEMIREQPLIGAGIGTFKWSYPAFRRPEIILLEGKSNTETDHAEDEYLEIWFDEGALGLGLFLWMLLTASASGLKTLSRLTKDGVPAGLDRERVYTLVAYLGAWWGALVHWAMDVSVRFVSSGIYSLLLPALVVVLSRPEAPVPVQDPPSPADRWVRGGTALFWTAIFLALPAYYSVTPLLSQIWSALLMGALLWATGEALSLGLSGYAPPAPVTEGRPPWPAAAAGAAVLAAWVPCAVYFVGLFKADIHHNVAIFFSRMGVWAKDAAFDGTAAGAPPEMREEYARSGGALEHYAKVVSLNPHFPMARYFIGNVYNDWGSFHFSEAQQSRARGDAAGAEAARARAKGDWDKAEAAYGSVKAFAPNYVQTHHQLGTLYMKRMELASAVGDEAGARAAGDEALRHFRLYRQLDPVFPPNHYRIAMLHQSRGEDEAAVAAYRDALAYNRFNVVGRVYEDRNIETNVLLGRAMLRNLEKAGKYNASDPAFQATAEPFYAALRCFDALGRGADYRRYAVDAHKALGVMFARAGDRAESIQHWSAVAALNPQDPDIRPVR